MKKFHFVLLVIFIVLGCERKTDYSQITYNQKANELIQQILINDSCTCIMEMPNESMIKISMAENSRFNIRKEIMIKLHLENQQQLDSLEKVSENFVLDTLQLQQVNITIIPRDSIRELTKDRSAKLIKKCPTGMLCFSKPILNKDKKAVLSYDQAFSCVGDEMRVYNYKNKKWIDSEN